MVGHSAETLAGEEEQQPYDDLQRDGQREQSNQGGVEAVLLAHVQVGLQLGRVGHQQGRVQHALGRRLLGDVVVAVDGPRALPGGARQSLEGQRHQKPTQPRPPCCTFQRADLELVSHTQDGSRVHTWPSFLD